MSFPGPASQSLNELMVEADALLDIPNGEPFAASRISQIANLPELFWDAVATEQVWDGERVSRYRSDLFQAASLALESAAIAKIMIQSQGSELLS